MGLMTARKDEFTVPAAPISGRDEPNGVRRDRFGRYLLPPCRIGPAPKKEVPFTRATTFAKSIADTYALSQWQQRMVAKGIAERMDLRLAAATLDVRADKDALNDVVEQAKEAAAAKSAARVGSAVHAFTERADRNETVDAQEYAPHVNAYSSALTTFGIQVLPGMIERIVVWNRYAIAGTFDRLATWQGLPVVLDLKTGRDLQYGWNEIAIQLAVYAHADGVWNPETWQWEPMPPVSREKALVVHLPVLDGSVETGAKAHLYEVDLRPAIDACRLCWEVREWRKTRGLAVELESPAPGHASQDWSARIAAASNIGDLTAVWDEMDAGARSYCKELFQRRAAQVRELAG
jgi:hypothetical protein